MASRKTNFVAFRVRKNSAPEGPSGMTFRVARNVGIKLGFSEGIRAEINQEAKREGGL